MDLQKLMNEKFDAIIASGAFDAMIEKSINKLLEELSSEYFRSYGEFGKNLKEHINKQLNISLDKLVLTEYSSVVCGIIKSTLENTVLEKATPLIETQINDFLKVLDKKEYKLSEVIKQFIEARIHNDEKEMTAIIRTSRWGSIYVSLDEDANTAERNCDYQFAISDKGGHIYNFEIKGKIPDPTKENISRGFDQFLFQLYACECKIIVDADECEELVEELQREIWD